MSPPRGISSPFRTEVQGTIFAERTAVVQRLVEGDELILVPDLPGVGEPAVWVHARGGDVVGHLPSALGHWMAPWMLAGGRCRATVARVGGAEVESWRRLVIRVEAVASAH